MKKRVGSILDVFEVSIVVHGPCINFVPTQVGPASAAVNSVK